MALVPDQKFSTFQNGGDLIIGDIIVGLRNGLNTRFTYTGELPAGVVIPIDQGGTGATTASQARINLGLGTIATQDASSVNITGGNADLTTGTIASAPVNGLDIVNKSYVDGLIIPGVTSVTGTLNRITSTGGFSPVIDIAATYVGQTSITTLGTVTNGTWQATTVGIGFGGTGVSSVTTTPTASNFAGWDAQKNLSAFNFIDGFTTTVTAAGITVLTVSSTYIQEFTGSTTQTVVMPVAATIVAGQAYYIINNSSGNVTLQSSGANTILVMAANTTALVTCVLNSGTTAASWNASYVFDNGAGVLSITGTANQVIASASTGAITLSLPQSIATTSAVQFASARLSNLGILDANNNSILTFNAIASAVNNLQAINSITTASPELAAVGSDTNIGINYRTKGTGAHNLFSNNTTIPVVWNSGTSAQHTTSWSIPNTAASRTVTLQDASGTMAYLADRGMVLLASATASNSATVVLTGMTGYSNYLIFFSNFTPATNATNLLVQFSTDNGSTFVSSAGAYRYQNFAQVNTSLTGVSATSTSVQLSNSHNNTAGVAAGGFIQILNPVGGFFTTLLYQSAYVDSSSVYRAYTTGARCEGTSSAINAIGFFMSSGNISTGNWQLYGVK